MLHCKDPYPHATSGKIGDIELADSITESADSTTNSVIISQLSLIKMFNILNPLESADGSRPTIGVGPQQIGLVGTGL